MIFQSKKKTINLFLSGVWLICLLAFLSLPSCKNLNTTSINALPEEDLINIIYTDTTSIVCETDRIDSIKTLSFFNSDFHMLGNYIDPDMGRIETGTYTQFRYPGEKLDFGDNDSLQADSILLDVEVIGYFGRVETPQHLAIYEIIQAWDTAKVNSSNDTLAINHAKELSGGAVINNNVIATLKSIHVKLDYAMAEKLLKLPASVKGGTIADFTNYFKGLYLTTSPLTTFNSREPGAIMYVALNSFDTKLTLYYHEMDSVGVFSKAKKFEFFAPNEASQFHHINRKDYTQTKLGKELASNPRKHEYEFIQSGAMIQTRINFPNLKNLGHVGINKAELVLKADPKTLGVKIGTTYRYEPPAIDIYQPDSTLKKIESALAFGATTFDPSTQTYSIQLTNYVQRILNDQLDNRGIIIQAAAAQNRLPNLINRVVLGGVKHPSLKPILKIHYTTLPK